MIAIIGMTFAVLIVVFCEVFGRALARAHFRALLSRADRQVIEGEGQ